jgi:hypothetical protein
MATRFPNGIKFPKDKIEIDDVAVTATAAELNLLDGVTASTAEINAVDGLAEGKFIAGEKFQVTFPNIAAADVAKAFFVAPAACKIISAYEIHGTVCDAADTLTIEKCTSGEDAGAGDVILAAAWTLNSTANTPVSKAGVTTAVGTLAAGDALLLKFASGDGTNYAEGCVTVTMQWV